MERAVFTYHPTDMPTLPHYKARKAMKKGRTVVIEGFDLGESEEDQSFLQSLTGARFAGPVRFKTCEFFKRLDLSDATFEKTLHLRDCKFHCGLDLMDTVVGARCSLRGSQIWDKGRPWLNWRGLKTGRGLHLINVTAHAPLDLYQAQIGGDLHLSGIRALAAGRNLDPRQPHDGLGEVQLHHVATEMPGIALNLRSARISGSVHIGPYASVSAETNGTHTGQRSPRSVRILGRLDLRADIGGDVNVTGARIGIDRASVAVAMVAARVRGSVFFQTGTRVTGSIDLRCSIDGQAAFNNARVRAVPRRTAIEMDSAEVGGSVFFIQGTYVTGAVHLRCRIGGGVTFDDSVIDVAPWRTAVLMEGASVAGTMFVHGGSVLNGTLSLLHAEVNGGLLTNSISEHTPFQRPDRPSNTQRMRRACQINGDLDLRSFRSGKSIVLEGASMLGRIRASHSTIAGDLRVCAGVVGAIDSRHEHRAREWAMVAGQYAWVQGQLERLRRSDALEEASYGRRLRKAVRGRAGKEEASASQRDQMDWYPWELVSTPQDANQTAIDLELADIQGHLWVRGQRVLGGVNAELARVKGDASFDRSFIEGDLVLRDAKIQGEFSAEPAAKSEPAPLVLGTIDASGGRFETVTMRLGDAAKQSGQLAGWYLFDSATAGVFRVLGHLECQGHKLFSVHRLGFGDLDLEGLTGGDYKWWTERDEWRVGLAIILAWVVFFVIVASDFPPYYGVVLGATALYLAVASVMLASGKAARSKAPRRPVLDFLSRSRFSAAFYIDAEQWARASGDDPRADEIFLERRRRELRERRPGLDAVNKPAETGDDPGFHWFTKWWRWGVLDFMFGYGVRPARTIHLFVLLWLLNWAVFLPAAAVERPVSFETQAAEAGTAPDPANPAWPGDGGTPGEGDHWGPQRAFFMAMRVQVPPVELFVDAEWKPADRAMFGNGVDGKGIALTYENYAAIMRILNLILVPVIIAGATGLLKPREAQYTGAS